MKSPSRFTRLNIHNALQKSLIFILIIIYITIFISFYYFLHISFFFPYFLYLYIFAFFSFLHIYLTSQTWACFLKRCFEVKDLQSRSNALHRGALIAVCCAPIGVCYAHIESLRSHGITALTWKTAIEYKVVWCSRWCSNSSSSKAMGTFCTRLADEAVIVAARGRSGTWLFDSCSSIESRRQKQAMHVTCEALAGAAELRRW